MTDKVKRRLTTVLCADVHGYSRLMEADEAGTLAKLRRYRTAIAGLVERHDGRIVNTWGDAVIAEFASVVEAVQCAIEIQQEVSSQKSDPADPHRMRFRIGINLGDVMADGSDIFGDGVNIAARLQELAEPGGVVISSTVYDQVHNKLSVGFDCLGQQQMKNVAPVITYRVAMAGGDLRGARSRNARAPRGDAGSLAAFHRGDTPSRSGSRTCHALLRRLSSLRDFWSCQSFHQPASALVPLAGSRHPVRCHPADGAPARPAIGQERRPLNTP